MRDPDRFRGCLVGGAIGDALGYAVEFMRAREIFEEYGERGITRYELRRGRAEISDDTQMTLFTAAGLLSADARSKDGGVPPDYVEGLRGAYFDWLDTQTNRAPLAPEAGGSWLTGVKELYARRAPGNTCLSALYRGGLGTPEQPDNESRGCGGVMRTAPVGLYCVDREELSDADCALLGARAAAITHGGDLGYVPAAALAHIVRTLASGRSASVAEAVCAATDAMPPLFPQAAHMERFTRLMNEAVALAQSDTDERAAIRALGEGWVGEEALAVAAFCAMRHPDDFESAMIAAVNHDGDSDSTGAIAGNILGAALGYGALPKCYLEKLELRGVIEAVADDLCRGATERYRPQGG